MQEKQCQDKKFVDEHLNLAFSTCFYGEIRIKFEKGRVVHVKKEQCFKPKN